MTPLERTYPRFQTHTCTRKPSRLHDLYSRCLDVVTLAVVAFLAWCFVVIFLGIG